ncbi:MULTISPECIES: HTH domain-containing protein [Staphylococcus]|uniref:Helix-turn-helix type 11 domain-containing protein n=2 Tax=Staphylococcus TaxID=1279 RepID=A0ABY1H1F3_9STAP|nr:MULTISPECIES: HTH domain-containing protein [Staphylococcus]KKI55795.1 hypothetical protein UF70_2234 [Staphylococcus pasteuri]MBM6506262.1 hypothetical protein [Staphylococcus pasteuri]MCF7599586.1 HTH domain-containing protein [Staphylococcus pasteuri]MDI3232038.1 HTH domain-containing protein [Staphylococcus pasteuri]MDO6573688.1 HTH domain-containing protein [Staphylococcus pasteuri_A]
MGYKTKRILSIYKKLLSNHHVNVKHMAGFFNTNERTIQRDIKDIKSFLNTHNQTIIYEKSTCNYYLSHQFTQDDDPTYINVTYEMTYQLYRQLNKQYETYTIQRTRQTITVVLAISESDALNLCFMYRHSLRMVSPQTLIETFSKELWKLQNNYILNKI